MARRSFIVKRMEARALTWWRARKDKIDMNPPYQRRGRLWSQADKAYLVDSILNEYDVPKIYIADFTWGDSPLNEKRLPYAIIDGKQRFEAIFDFFEGKLVLNEDFIWLNNPDLKMGGLSYQDIQSQYFEAAEIFDNFNLSIMSVYADSEGPITELFVRLNRSKPLTGAEIRNAMSGPTPGLIREIAKHSFFTENIRFTVSRAQDLNSAAKLLMIEYYGELRETKKRNLDLFAKSVSDKDKNQLELAARRTIDILDDLSEIFLPHDNLLSAAGIIPVYYWLVRELAASHYPRVRKFINEFERDRRHNRRVRENLLNDDEVDQKMLRYDQFNRSTNDLSSHIGRFEILYDRFVMQMILE